MWLQYCDGLVGPPSKVHNDRKSLRNFCFYLLESMEADCYGHCGERERERPEVLSNTSPSIVLAVDFRRPLLASIPPLRFPWGE